MLRIERCPNYPNFVVPCMGSTCISHAVLPLLVKHHIAGKYGPQLSRRDCSSYHGLTKSAQCNSLPKFLAIQYSSCMCLTPNWEEEKWGGGGGGGGGGGSIAIGVYYDGQLID